MDRNTQYVLSGPRVVDVLYRHAMVKSGRVNMNAQTATARPLPRKKIRRGRMGASVLG